jgi:hypothetical protein
MALNVVFTCTPNAADDCGGQGSGLCQDGSKSFQCDFLNKTGEVLDNLTLTITFTKTGLPVSGLTCASTFGFAQCTQEPNGALFFSGGRGIATEAHGIGSTTPNDLFVFSLEGFKQEVTVSAVFNLPEYWGVAESLGFFVVVIALFGIMIRFKFVEPRWTRK